MKQVFIVGYPRSGTTLVQTILGTGSHVLSLPESHYFALRYFCPFDRLPLPPLLSDRIFLPRRSTGKPYFQHFVMDPRFGVNRFGSRPLPDPDVFISELDRVAAREHCTSWVEKTPGHLRRIRPIVRAAPNSVFIHVHRRFTPVYNSTMRAWSQLPSEDTHTFSRSRHLNMRNWMRDIERTLYWVSENPAHHMVLRFEDICSQTASAFESMLDHTCIQASADAWKKFNQVAGMVVGETEKWKSRNRESEIRLRPCDCEPDEIASAESTYMKLPSGSNGKMPVQS